MSLVTRHRLVHIRPQRLMDMACERADPAEREGLTHWAAMRLPLVVTRQPEAGAHAVVCLGLPLPHRWGGARLSLDVDKADILYFSDFPRLGDVLKRAPLMAIERLQTLQLTLRAQGLVARVYGSHGWQYLSGLPCAHARSDLDLLLHVDSRRQADHAVACLAALDHGQPRIDGELIFPDGCAVAWREWQSWRQGRTRHVLSKTTAGASLVCDRRWQQRERHAQSSAAA